MALPYNSGALRAPSARTSALLLLISSTPKESWFLKRRGPKPLQITWPTRYGKPRTTNQNLFLRRWRKFQPPLAHLQWKSLILF